MAWHTFVNNLRRYDIIWINVRRHLSLTSSLNKQMVCPKKDDSSSEPHCIYDMCAIKPGTPQPCVVIIGGGMSGLSAASRLVQCGITNFRVLEAMDGPGGRMRTCWMGDSVAEAGWPYIEGASLANTTYTLAAQERLLSTPLRRIEEDVGLVLTSEGRALDSDTTARAKSIFSKIEAAATEPAEGYPLPTSLADRLQSMIKENVEKLPKFERWDTLRALNGLLGTLRSKLGACLHELSPSALSEISSLPGGNVRLKGGMAALVAPLVRDLPAGAVVYCKPVNTVLWGTAGPGAPRAVVKCCDGENYPADYVIVTVPLGVLKKTAEKLFCPELPAFKMEAIRGLGFGSINKIFLKFEKPFWAAHGGEILLAWSPTHYAEEKTWLKGISGLELLSGSSKVLCATVSGQDAAEMESLTDSQIADNISIVLKKFLGCTILPNPSEIQRSSWSNSPYFMGFKTYMSKTSSRGLLVSLSKPLPSECDTVPPIIFFAGEHTHPEHFGTLHGSRLSGIREADRIVELTKRFNGPPNKGPVCIPCT